MTPDAGEDRRCCRACGGALFMWNNADGKGEERLRAGFCSRICERSGPQTKCPRCRNPHYSNYADRDPRPGVCGRCWCAKRSPQ